jgi:hypothetical protein
MSEDYLPAERIESKIYLIPGHKVMLDRDLAQLYGVHTKVLNQAVRRNLSRFPADFMFQLSEIEDKLLKSQFVTSNLRRGGIRKLPFAFTEYGVAMLSSVLRSEQAIQVNITIMRTFGKLREILASNRELAKKLSQLESKYDHQFKAVFEAIREIMSQHAVPRKRIIGLNNPHD